MITACRRLLATSLLLGLLGCTSMDTGPAWNNGIAVDLGTAEVGQAPTGFTQDLTGGGRPGSWVVRADAGSPGGGKVLIQESNDDTSYRFPVCICNDIVTRNVAAEVRIKAIAGEVDQVGGLVLRYRPENYYVVRIHAFNNNIVLFKMVRGNRIRIKEVAIPVKPQEWHTLGFAITGSHLTVVFNGRTVIEVDDTTHSGQGRVGLWTKADSVTAFSGLRITTNDIDPVPQDVPLTLPPGRGTDVDAVLLHARQTHRCALVVTTDSGDAATAARVQDFLNDPRVQEKLKRFEMAILDLDSSRSRATGLGLHIASAPAVLIRSPSGLAVARDETFSSADTLASLLDQAEATASGLDAGRSALEAKVAANPDVAGRRLALADFLLAHEGWREAMPHLEQVAESPRVPVGERIRASVLLARAHFTVAEPEHGRARAKRILATLGPDSAEARSAGHLLIGIRDGELERTAKALKELDQAMAEAPGSVYAQEAREARARISADP